MSNNSLQELYNSIYCNDIDRFDSIISTIPKDELNKPFGDEIKTPEKCNNYENRNYNLIDKIKSFLTPLILAIMTSTPECEDHYIINKLIDDGADINMKSALGGTLSGIDNIESPLTFASMFNNIKLVKVLLERGANPSIENAIGNTPLFIAIKNWNYEMVEELLKYGANVKYVSKLGRSAIIIAKETHVKQLIDIITKAIDDRNKFENKLIIAVQTPRVLYCLITKDGLQKASYTGLYLNDYFKRLQSQGKIFVIPKTNEPIIGVEKCGRVASGGKRKTRRAKKSRRKNRT